MKTLERKWLSEEEGALQSLEGSTDQMQELRRGRTN